jgi:hypothetical protein
MTIMSDSLIRQLRYSYPSIKERFELLERAADRIEELEEKLSTELLGKAGLRRVADGLQKRVWSLEAALREITTFAITDRNNNAVYEDSTHELRKIARRALEGQP